MVDDEKVIAEQSCRHCGAKRGEVCTTKFRGAKPTKPHKIRRDDWAYFQAE